MMRLLRTVLLKTRSGPHRLRGRPRWALLAGGVAAAALLLLLLALSPPLSRQGGIGRLQQAHRKLSSKEQGGEGWLSSGRCAPPRLNLTAPALGKECITLEDVCFDQERVILYGEEYSPLRSPNVKPFPNFTVSDVLHNWVWGDVIGDVYENGSSLHFPNITFRMHSKAEPTEDLRDPVFNECRIPLVIWQNFPFNYFETIVHTLTRVHMLEADGSMGRDVDLVIATPWGQALKSYHTQLLEPFTAHKIRSFADFSDRQLARQPASGSSVAAASGEPGRCFKKAMLCKWKGAEYWDAWHAMQWVDTHHRPALRQWAEQLKIANWRFARSSTLRVLFDARQGPVRNLLNAPELIRACNQERKWHIDKDSRFKSIRCDYVHFSNSVQHNAEAVRNSHVLVGAHGSGLSNALLMRPGSGLLELLPYNFTECCGPSERFYASLLRWNRDTVHYWSLSIEDPSAWRPGAFEVARVKRGDDPIPFDMRDRHLTVRWEVLKDALERIASVDLDWKKYSRVREEGGHHLAMTEDDIMTLKEFQRVSEIKKAEAEAAAAAAGSGSGRGQRQLSSLGL